ncbi:MAG: restriction endonuclease subunit S [Deltaproteobacteria bacterium]|nr:restriction endonuclease subunit S [Deltaproteobacteria bacterium]
MSGAAIENAAVEVDGELPEGWTHATLGGVADVQLGKMLDKAKRIRGQRLPYLRNANVRWGRFDLGDLEEMPFEDHELERYGLKNGDLLACEGGEPGRCAIWDGGPTDIKYQKALLRVRPSSGVVAKWIMFQLRHDALGGRLETYFTGSTIKHFPREAALRYRLVLAPLPEQRHIVAKVEALLAQVNASRERLAKVPALLKRFRQSVLAAACSGRLTEEWRAAHGSQREAASDLAAFREARRLRHEAAAKTGKRRIARPTFLEEIEHDQEVLPELEEIPAGWTLVAVGNACERLQYGTSDKADDEARGGVPVLRMGNIQDGRLDLGDLKFMRETHELRCFRLCHGDVIFNRTNSPELVGKAALVDVEQPLLFASYLVRVQTAAEILDPAYLTYWINSALGRVWARRIRTDGVSQSNINATKLAEMPLPLPPLGEQREIVRRVATLFRLADTIEARVAAGTARADKLTQAVLARAFRGELVPTEAALARREGRTPQPAIAQSKPEPTTARRTERSTKVRARGARRHLSRSSGISS